MSDKNMTKSAIAAYQYFQKIPNRVAVHLRVVYLNLWGGYLVYLLILMYFENLAQK